MAISPISSVSFRSNYNQVNFEGKKESKNSGMQIPTSVKAIPLAAMIAMSPLNDIDAKNVIEAGYTKVDNVTSVYGPNTKRFVYNDDYSVKSAMPENVKVTFYSPDGDSTPEHVSLKYSKNNAGRKNIDGVMTDIILKDDRNLKVKSVKIVNVTRKNINGTETKYKEYYAVGFLNSLKTMRNKKDDSLIEDRGWTQKENYEEQITKEFYDNIVDTMGDNIPQLVENRTTKETESHYHIYM